jgi:predicted transposase YbfD/YdcC
MCEKILLLCFRRKKVKILETHIATQKTTFYLALQNSATLDLRDNRGKKHNLPYVLLGLTIAILRDKDGFLSKIHRSMVNTHELLRKELKSIYSIDNEIVVSRSHLPILLKKVSVTTFSSLVFDYFGVELNSEIKDWFALDGKELRGTIQSGDKRGEAIVQVVSHDNMEVMDEGYYNGNKESEQPAIQDLLKRHNLASQGLTFDALHFNPKTLNYIHYKGGTYVANLKGNQEEVNKDMAKFITLQNADFQYFEQEKGHGREETRTYSCKDVSGEYFDKRWKFAGLTTVIIVKRTRCISNAQKHSEDVSYYMSNQKVKIQDNANGLYKRIRGHWAVETNNHIRDVTLKEDNLQTKFQQVARPISLIRTLIINLLNKQKINNRAAFIDECNDSFQKTIEFLKSVKVL